MGKENIIDFQEFREKEKERFVMDVWAEVERLDRIGYWKNSNEINKENGTKKIVNIDKGRE
jgi:hypothetical protein